MVCKELYRELTKLRIEINQCVGKEDYLQAHKLTKQKIQVLDKLDMSIRTCDHEFYDSTMYGNVEYTCRKCGYVTEY
jgi:hypothetical protein